MELKPGDQAPAFSLPDEDGKIVSTKDLKGSRYVVYFYPKDDTPGCTVEACGFRDEYVAFAEAGAEVVGISSDSVASHEHFADKLFLSVKGLASDGSLTDPDPLECEVKRAMIDRAEESILLLQSSKLLERGSHLIASCSRLSLVIAADLSPNQVRQLEGTGVKLRCVD